MRGQGNHGNATRGFIGLKLAGGFPSVNHGQAHIHQDEIGRSAARLLQTFSATSQAIAQYQDALAQVTGLFVLQRWGREQESEADHIGLIYMARAGYDPHVAIDFWQRMAAQSSGAPPEWLSTHPSDVHRINDIRRLMPEAERVYKGAGGAP